MPITVLRKKIIEINVGNINRKGKFGFHTKSYFRGQINR
ncbi:MAG: hypothetical protein ACI897_001020 [Flavobacteriales bacterium]|jgi:hypothetical protein